MMVPKFRAYIKDLDEFDYNDVPHKGHFVYGNLIKGKPNDDVDAIVGDLIEINDEYVNVEWWCSIEKGSAEQYTGLEDAYGKEIYEGDIVRGYYQEPDIDDGYDGSSMVETVNFRWGSFWLGDFKNQIMLYTPPIIEVIGNVHTNPELVEAKND